MAHGARRGWRRRHGLFVAVAAGVLVGSAGCSAVAPADPTPGVVETPAASASPTPTVTVVAGGERPPIVVDECSDLISIGELSAAVGVQVQALERLETDERSENVGAVLCGWSTPEHPDASDAGALWVMPRAGMDAEEFADLGSTAYGPCFFGFCSSSVAGQNELVAVRVPVPEPYDASAEQQAVTVSQTVGAAVLSTTDDRGATWVRDRAQWLASIDCNAVGAAVGEAIGLPVQADPFLPYDPPGLFVTLADRAMQARDCYLQTSTVPDAAVLMSTAPGMAWSEVNASQEGYSGPQDLGAGGVSTYADGESSLFFVDTTNRVDAHYDPLDLTGANQARDAFPPEVLAEIASRILAGEFSS